jgi:UDP-2-acetamido-3-amino-2,3-dideoxy-glucuronate N-acetyltransferase
LKGKCYILLIAFHPSLLRPKLRSSGTAYWGKNLARNYHALGGLKLIYDKNETVRGQFQVQYPQVDTCLALNEVLNRDDTQD